MGLSTMAIQSKLMHQLMSSVYHNEDGDVDVTRDVDMFVPVGSADGACRSKSRFECLQV